ncbi:MAG TPA: extracellular solute-binding protein [Candidatus Pelethocola excrementipullorum]|nr:extracellular solute-binding protein [Candidatus Pelethocola excrementipullorum]
MRRKLKAIVSIILAAAMLFGMAGCQNTDQADNNASSGGTDSDDSAASDGKTIEFWNFFTGPDGENMNQMIQDFNSTNPAYKINNVTMAGGDMYQKIPTVVNSGKGVPDLCIVDVARIPMFEAQGLLEPMDYVLENKPEIKKENYRDAVWNTGTIDGTQYSIPLDMGVTGLLYNKNLVEKYAPNVLDDNVVTIDEIMEIIPEAKKDGIVTIPVSFFTYEMALSLAAQKGGYMFGEDELIPTTNTTQFKDAYQTLLDIQEAGGGSEDGDDNLQLFINNMSIFCHTGVWDYNALKQAEDLEWGMTNTIAYSADKVVNYSNSNQFVLFKSSERTDEKMEVIADFLDFVRENTMEWARSGQVPASRSADGEKEFQEMPGFFYVSSPEIEGTIAFKSYKYGGIVDDAFFETHMEAIWGRMSVDDMLAQVQKQAEDNIAQQQ